MSPKGILKTTQSETTTSDTPRHNVRFEEDPYLIWFKELIVAIQNNTHPDFFRLMENRRGIYVGFERINTNMNLSLQMALQIAIFDYHSEAVQYAINAGALVNAPLFDPTIRSLDLAALRNADQVAETLIANGARLNETFVQQVGPAVALALQVNNFRVAKLMISRGALIGKDIWDYFLRSKHVKALEFLVSMDFNFANVPDESGRLSLHWAVLRGHFELFPLLLKLTSNINAQDKQLMTPMHYACKRQDDIACIKLNTAGANVNVVNILGQTPLMLAAEMAHYQRVDLLLMHGARANEYDLDGNLPIDYVPHGPHSLHLKRVLEAEAAFQSSPTHRPSNANPPRSYLPALQRWQNTHVKLISAVKVRVETRTVVNSDPDKQDQDPSNISPTSYSTP